MIDLSGQERRRYLDHPCSGNWRSPSQSRPGYQAPGSGSPVSQSSISNKRFRHAENGGERRKPKSRNSRRPEVSVDSRPGNEHQLYCCCSRKSSACSKSPNSPCSSSADSLLALLLVAVTSCCQALTVGLMASLPSQHSPPLGLSTGTSGLGLGTPGSVSPAASTQAAGPIPQPISMATHYVVPMPAPGSPGAPHFIGNNVTEFMERFKEQCDEHGVQGPDVFKKLPRYCEKTIGDFVKTMPEWLEGNWLELCVVMKKEYARRDVDQQINSRQFLEAFKSKARDDKDDLRAYSRQFRSVAMSLIKIGQLDNYTMTLWYIQGLPKSVASKMIRKHEIDLLDASTLNFGKCYDTVMAMVEVALTLQQLDPTSNAKSNYLALADRFQGASPEVPAVPHHVAFAPPVISPLAETKTVFDSSAIDALTKSFENLRVNAVHSVQPDTLRHLIRQELAGRPYSATVQGTSSVQTSTSTQPQPLPQVHVHTQQASTGAQPYSQPYPSYDRPAIGPNQCLFCREEGHRKRDCPPLNALIIEGKVYLNERFRLCYGRVDQKGPEMRLPSSMSQVDGVRLCLREQKTQHAVQMKTIRIEKMGSSDEDDTDSEPKDMIVKIRAARQEVDSKTRKTSWKPALEASAKVLKDKAAKEGSLPKAKNLRSGNYRDTIDLSKPNPIDVVVSVPDITMRDAKQPGQPDFRATKFQKLKQTKGTTETSVGHEERDKPQKMQYLVKDVADARAVTRDALETKIEIKLLDLLGLCPGINRTFFRSVEEREAAALKALRPKSDQSVKVKSICANTTEAVHMDDLVMRIASLKAMCVVACPKAFVSVGDVKVKALFDSGAEINCISKKLADEAGLPIRHGTAMSMVAATGDSAKFVGICDDLEVRLGGATITVPAFVVAKSDHSLILGRPFERSARMSSTNMDDGSLELVVHSDDGSTRVSFLAMPADHPRNRETDTSFTVESLN